MKSITSHLSIALVLALANAPLPIQATYSFKRGAASVVEYMQTRDGRARSVCAALSLTAATAGIFWLCKNGWKSSRPTEEKAACQDKKRIAAKLGILAGLIAIGSFLFESHVTAEYFDRQDEEAGYRAWVARMTEPIVVWPRVGVSA